MRRKLTTLLCALFVALALVSGGESYAADSLGWQKFVTQAGQAWLTNGVCADEDHIPPIHIDESEWHGGWVRILKDPQSTDLNPQFTVEVSTNIADAANWASPVQVFRFASGEDASVDEAPDCEGGVGPPGIEHIKGTVQLRHRQTPNGPAEVPARHKVHIYLWKQKTENGKIYGPLQLVFLHEGPGSLHNGIVH
jgi:hypothetical protein